MTDPRIEAAARAIYAIQRDNARVDLAFNIGGFDADRDHWMNLAAAALAAADAVTPVKEEIIFEGRAFSALTPEDRGPTAAEIIRRADNVARRSVGRILDARSAPTPDNATQAPRDNPRHDRT